MSLVFLFLAISAGLSIFEPSPQSDPLQDELLARGWASISHPPCALARPGFYALESEWESRELHLFADGSLLASSPQPWPDTEVHCRSISQPTFIQEIQ